MPRAKWLAKSYLLTSVLCIAVDPKYKRAMQRATNRGSQARKRQLRESDYIVAPRSRGWFAARCR